MNTTPAKYRGISGAFAYGIAIVALVAVLAALAAVFLWATTGQTDTAVPLVKRLMLFGGLFGFAALLCRWLAKAECNRLLGLRFERGDFGSLGAVAGLLTAGALTATPWQSALNDVGESKIRIGQEIQIAGPTVDGGRFEIRENLGQVTVVDFWATWCQPCVKALPDLVKLYERNKDKGLRVVGVSLDTDQSQLEAFLVKNPLPWKQIFFGPEGNPLADRYGVNLIPHVIVVDREGKVAADDVHGSSLVSAVKKALSEASADSGQPLAYRRWFDWLMRGVLSSNAAQLAGYLIGGAILALGLELLVRSAFKK